MRIEEAELLPKLICEGAVVVVMRAAINSVVDPKATETGGEDVLS
jgi:hypothetical protein